MRLFISRLNLCGFISWYSHSQPKCADTDTKLLLNFSTYSFKIKMYRAIIKVSVSGYGKTKGQGIQTSQSRPGLNSNARFS